MIQSPLRITPPPRKGAKKVKKDPDPIPKQDQDPDQNPEKEDPDLDLLNLHVKDLTKRGKRRSVGNLRANQKVQKKDIIMKPKMMTLHQGLPMLMIS